MLRTTDLEYDLPSELIAARPSERRDEARLMVLRRKTGAEDGPARCVRCEHRQVRDLPELLTPGDALILNNTRVLPARFRGVRVATGGRIEGLYLHELDGGDCEVMLKSNGRIRPGTRIELVDASQRATGHVFQAIERSAEGWRVRMVTEAPLRWALETVGLTPLSPYILRQRRDRPEQSLPDEVDRQRYQTVYAGPPGAVAAPTAGLHFTEELMSRLRERGMTPGWITLHVGAGTFKPVETEYVEQHPIHAEHFDVPAETLELIRRTRQRGGRIVAVGTTTVRTLESLSDPLPEESTTGRTNLLITPGFRFRFVDALMTNFHLPRSSLLALVAAITGLEPLMEAYREAIGQRYRFYSYGDSMLIL